MTQSLQNLVPDHHGQFGHPVPTVTYGNTSVSSGCAHFSKLAANGVGGDAPRLTLWVGDVPVPAGHLHRRLDGRARLLHGHSRHLRRHLLGLV